MSDSFLGEIQAFPIVFAASGLIGNGTWLPCFGQSVSVHQYAALFSLIGTSYGGNGTTNFNLPNMNGHIVASQGAGPGLTPRTIGETWGQDTVTLNAQQMAIHSHSLQLGTGATGAQPGPGTGAGMVAINPKFNGFIAPPSNTTFALTAVSMTGGSGPHNNDQPTLAIVYCICISGVFPTFN
jgi:microcystin-dependent protein